MLLILALMRVPLLLLQLLLLPLLLLALPFLTHSFFSSLHLHLNMFGLKMLLRLH